MLSLSYGPREVGEDKPEISGLTWLWRILYPPSSGYGEAVRGKTVEGGTVPVCGSFAVCAMGWGQYMGFSRPRIACGCDLSCGVAGANHSVTARRVLVSRDSSSICVYHRWPVVARYAFNWIYVLISYSS